MTLQGKLKNLLRPILRPVLDILMTSYGFLKYCFVNQKKHQPMDSKAYLAMIRLFCWSRGYSNDLYSFIHGLFVPKVKFKHAQGILGNLDKPKIKDIVKSLKKDGYYVCDTYLPDDVIDKLIQFSLSQEFNLLGDNCQDGQRSKYDRDNPKAAKYILPTELLLNCPEFQDIIADLSLLSVAQEYLGCEPKFDIPGIALSTTHKDANDQDAAQMYHFDMDRLKWLKVFFYLSDVDEHSGPHTYIKGSHKSGSIPKSLLKHHYARLSDEEVLKHFKQDDVIKFTGKKGTIILEDTRGLHKGTRLSHGERIMLSVQFSNSLAGCDFTFKHKFKTISSPMLQEALGMYPNVYKGYNFS